MASGCAVYEWNENVFGVKRKGASFMLRNERLFLCHRKLRPMTQKRSAGGALARRRNMSQATALGARMCQGTFFFKLQQNDLMLLTYPFHLFRPDTCLYLANVGAV